MQVDDNSRKEEGVRDRAKRSRSEKGTVRNNNNSRIQVGGKTGEEVKGRERRSRNEKGAAQNGNDERVDQGSGRPVDCSQSPKSLKIGEQKFDFGRPRVRIF